PQPQEQPFEVVLPRLLDLAALDVDVVHAELALGDQFVEVEAQRADVLRQLLGGLLEGHEDTRLVVLGGALDEELQAQQRLAAAGAAADERGPAARQPAPGDLVQPLDARGGLGEPPRGRLTVARATHESSVGTDTKPSSVIVYRQAVDGGA